MVLFVEVVGKRIDDKLPILLRLFSLRAGIERENCILLLVKHGIDLAEVELPVKGLPKMVQRIQLSQRNKDVCFTSKARRLTC